jgi:hypothetical protein
MILPTPTGRRNVFNAVTAPTVLAKYQIAARVAPGDTVVTHFAKPGSLGYPVATEMTVLQVRPALPGSRFGNRALCSHTEPERKDLAWAVLVVDGDVMASRLLDAICPDMVEAARALRF